MGREIPVLAVLFVVLAVSGCASLDDAAGSGCAGSCADDCSGSTRLHGGWCVLGECKYSHEECAHGCSEGSCLPEPHGLVLEGNPQQKNGFRLEIKDVGITRASTAEGEEPKDDYAFAVSVTKMSGDGGIFAINSASIVAETGLMHGTVGFGWSEFVAAGKTKGTAFAIRGVPSSIREQNTTVIIRTNQGHYYYEASFAETAG